MSKIMAAVLAAASAAALMLSIQASTAQASTCAGTLELNSAKDNCGVNVRIGWQEGGTNWKACMNPGGERPNPGRFNRILPGGC